MILAISQHPSAETEAGKLDCTPNCLRLYPHSWATGVAKAARAGGVTLAPGGGQLLTGECTQGMGNIGGGHHEVAAFPVHLIHSQADQNNIPFLN